MPTFTHTYVTNEEVLFEMGLEDNKNISADKIDRYVKFAEGAMDSALRSGGYSLPLVDTCEEVRECVILYAAGSFMLKDFPVGQGDALKNPGEEKLKRAQATLDLIAKGKKSLVYDSGDPVDIVRTSISFWPDDTTKDEDIDNAGGERSFRIMKKF